MNSSRWSADQKGALVGIQTLVWIDPKLKQMFRLADHSAADASVDTQNPELEHRASLNDRLLWQKVVEIVFVSCWTRLSIATACSMHMKTAFVFLMELVFDSVL